MCGLLQRGAACGACGCIIPSLNGSHMRSRPGVCCPRVCVQVLLAVRGYGWRIVCASCGAPGLTAAHPGAAAGGAHVKQPLLGTWHGARGRGQAGLGGVAGRRAGAAVYGALLSGPVKLALLCSGLLGLLSAAAMTYTCDVL